MKVLIFNGSLEPELAKEVAKKLESLSVDFLFIEDEQNNETTPDIKYVAAPELKPEFPKPKSKYHK